MYLLAESEDGLDSDVHDHHALGTEMEGKNFEGIGDKQTGETNIVEDAKEPNKGNLCVSGASIRVPNTAVGLIRGRGGWDLGVFVDGTSDGPKNECAHHTSHGGQEEGTTANLVDKKGSTNGETKINDSFAGGELDGGQSCFET